MRNLKKVIALVAVFAMLVSTVAFAQTYSDVAATDTYAEAIETLSALGILTGDDADNDGKMDFRPADTITRAEVAAIVCRIQNLSVANQTTTPFEDVPSSHWASGYIAQAAGQGIINGYGDGNFGPDDNVEYQDVIKMLMETLGYNLFAQDQGGYPTGYLTAAQRYGVLDGVVGGAPYTEANRGMVAQMVYNAIDTPIMDKYSYGADAQYMIYDGTNGLSYVTLLTRDLKMKKVTGTVIANSYTDLLNGSTEIDTEQDKTIVIDVDYTDANILYGFNAINGLSLTVDQADVDADGMLGYAISAYVKEELVAGKYSLVSIAKNDAKNDEISFTLDEYESITSNTNYYQIAYLPEGARTEKTVRVPSDATIIYNGVAGAATLADGVYFGGATDNENTALIIADGTRSGRVTFVDTDDTAVGYETINIEVAVSGVVEEILSNGQVALYTAVQAPGVEATGLSNSNVNRINFTGDDKDVLVNLTKDGEAYDYTQLQEWDVITILKGNNCELYNITVLGEANYVDGYVTATRPTTSGQTEYKLSDGNWYVANAKGEGLNLKAGSAGRFFIDAYGKIVARDEDVVIEGVDSVAAENYAFVLDATTATGTWSDQVVINVLLLDKNGEIYESTLASKTKLYNVDATLDTAWDTVADGEAQLNSDDATAEQKAALAAGMINKLISYDSNSSGEVDEIVFSQSVDEDKDMYYVEAGTAADFDADDRSFSSATEIDDETIVFYVKAAGNSTMTYGGAVKADKDICRVATGADLVESKYDYVSFDNVDGTANAVVILNTTGALSPASGVAVISSVGKTYVNGDDVAIVEFYMGGEKMTANTDADLDATNDILEAKLGDVWKFNVSNGVITEAREALSVTRSALTTTSTGVSVDVQGTPESAIEEYFFGAATAISNRGNVTLSAADGSTVTSIKATDGEIANVYVVDPNYNKEAQLFVGTFDDIMLDETLVTPGYKIQLSKPTLAVGKNYTVAADGTGAYELLDYVFADYYDGDAVDIVVYKPYTFSYKLVDNTVSGN